LKDSEESMIMLETASLTESTCDQSMVLLNLMSKKDSSKIIDMEAKVNNYNNTKYNNVFRNNLMMDLI